MPSFLWKGYLKTKCTYNTQKQIFYSLSYKPVFKILRIYSSQFIYFKAKKEHGPLSPHFLKTWVNKLHQAMSTAKMKVIKKQGNSNRHPEELHVGSTGTLTPPASRGLGSVCPIFIPGLKEFGTLWNKSHTMSTTTTSEAQSSSKFKEGVIHRELTVVPHVCQPWWGAAFLRHGQCLLSYVCWQNVLCCSRAMGPTDWRIVQHKLLDTCNTHPSIHFTKPAANRGCLQKDQN